MCNFDNSSGARFSLARMSPLRLLSCQVIHIVVTATEYLTINHAIMSDENTTIVFQTKWWPHNALFLRGWLFFECFCSLRRSCDDNSLNCKLTLQRDSVLPRAALMSRASSIGKLIRDEPEISRRVANRSRY